MIKQILIPMAAFAITATSVAAYSNTNWSDLGVSLTDNQVSALEQAKEIRDNAQDQAKQILTNAGIDEAKMKEIGAAMHKKHDAEREAVQTAITNNDFNAFLTAIADSPLADKITSQADFEKFTQAQELMKSGDKDGATTIFTELGIEKFGGKDGGRGRHGDFGGPDLD